MYPKCRMRASTAILAALTCLGYAAAVQPAAAQESDTIETVVVLGVRGAEQKAVDLKRNAASIQDSIAAEDIGKLPDVTIADSLQRITGVQIDRSAGEGSGVNIRGLPQVGTTLNGETFLTSGSIVSVQPSFTDVPSQLFAGADVVKTPTAGLLNGGITGTIDLKTRRPLDLANDLTVSASVDTAHGFESKKWEPELNALVGYNHETWGFLVSASYADVTMENSQDGFDLFGGQLFGENAASATEYNGFIGAWGSAPIPSGIKVLDANGNVDVDGDGVSKSAFYGTENATVFDRQVERKRTGFNTAFQARLAPGLTMTTEFFYTGLEQYHRTAGYELQSTSWIGATFVPTVTRDTGAKVSADYNSDAKTLEFFTTQVYDRYLGDITSYSASAATKTSSRNYNLQLDYDNGGNFTASVRGLYADASEAYMNSYVQFSMADGALWNTQGGVYSGTTTYHFPTSAGGDRAFNTNGFVSNTLAATIDSRGDHLKITMPASLLSGMDSKDAWSLKTVSSQDNYVRDSDMMVLRADAHYRFGESGFGLDGGVRYSQRTAENTQFNLVAPMFAGAGASSASGCYVLYKAIDVTLDGGGVAGACTAGDAAAYYVGNPYGGYSMGSSAMPDAISKHIKQYSDIAGVKGISYYNLNPKAQDNVLAFQNALFPGEERNINPGATWRVGLNQLSGYVQGSAEGTLYLPYSLNAGVRIIETYLDVTQHVVGNTQAYGMYAADNGTTVTSRSFTDILPTVNLSVDLRDDLKMRMAYSRNMQLLDLNQWGGGLTLGYSLDTTSGIFAVQSGSQDGNPNLDPWRSSNYDLSFEYYIDKSSMINVALFYIDVDRWIATDSVNRCDLPDQDGVVRGRCVTITGPVQGHGKNLKGVEVAYRQAFDFLPGIWRNFGTELNFTYSPSNVGTDIAGHKIPFQDNSERQANMILWYQDDAFQARLAGNYRSKRAVSSNYGGINGFEMYQKPTFYLDASASYDIDEHLQFYVQGANILGEEEHYYFVWTDQVADTTRFEPRLTLGVRARF